MDIRGATENEPRPESSALRAAALDERRFFQAPVLHALTVPAGPHRMRVTSSVIAGSAEATFQCDDGDVLYGAVASRIEGTSFWSKGRLQAKVTIAPDMPAGWNAYSIALYRNGSWLVDPEPDTQRQRKEDRS